MAHSDNDFRCREIITNAVCGRGSKYSQTTHTIRPANRPTTVGGCWVMNHSFDAELIGDYVEVHGQFDVNVWYSYKGNSETAVAKDTISYVEQIPLRELDPNSQRDGMTVEVKVIEQPNCLDCTLVDSDSEILVRVEKELAVEIIGQTKVYVLVCNPNEKDDDGELGDEYEDEEEDFDI